MRLEEFPEDIAADILPSHKGSLAYICLGCERRFSIKDLLYTCPECGQVLMIEDEDFDSIKERGGSRWRKIFDYRKMASIPQLKGIYRYHEFIGPVIPLSDIVYLGEGNTPLVQANGRLEAKVGRPFFFKNDGQNPSASFKDRGMASALSYINHLLHAGDLEDVLAVCASTGDTSAAAALYAAYLKPNVKSAVILPHDKVTQQQLFQPLGSGAQVFEIPGVFDDCMKVVEALSEKYPVALLNSKNAWRILGQESYSYEIAQDFDFDTQKLVIVVPIGNAGNITAVMNGFLKFFSAGVIDALPKIVGVQSSHADPVFRYYSEPDPVKRRFIPVSVKSSVAQAAMIGNPVSMPRVINLVDAYNRAAGSQRTFFIRVSEQEIIEWTIKANKHGHIACTHGGESLAGFAAAIKKGYVAKDELGIIDSTAHILKFSGFVEMYFDNRFPPEFEIVPDPDITNRPCLISTDDSGRSPAGREKRIDEIANRIARKLSLL